MRSTSIATAALTAAMLGLTTLGLSATGAERAELYPKVERYVEARIAEFEQIKDERKAQLDKLSAYVAGRVKADEPVRLTFICTHNSRRSHLAQIWAAVAAAHYRIDNVETFSGGTERTAFNPRAIAAVERAGLKVEQRDKSKNPHYAVSFSDDVEALSCFSKVYSDPANPQSDYGAVMTCSQADAACPLVTGAALRIALPYDDPKSDDGTPNETQSYDDRSAQICREMLYVFSRVKK